MVTLTLDYFAVVFVHKCVKSTTWLWIEVKKKVMYFSAIVSHSSNQQSEFNQQLQTERSHALVLTKTSASTSLCKNPFCGIVSFGLGLSRDKLNGSQLKSSAAISLQKCSVMFFVLVSQNQTDGVSLQRCFDCVFWSILPAAEVKTLGIEQAVSVLLQRQTVLMNYTNWRARPPGCKIKTKVGYKQSALDSFQGQTLAVSFNVQTVITGVCVQFTTRCKVYPGGAPNRDI